MLIIFGAAKAQAQDVPGIEICTAEKTMERRTSCLQSNVNFLQQSIGKLRLDQEQRLDAIRRQTEALKATVAALQKTVEELQAAQIKAAAAQAKPAPAAVPAPAPAKDQLAK
jgi:seryl-tRNA synthetase